MPRSVVFSWEEASREISLGQLLLEVPNIVAERFHVFPRSRYVFLNFAREVAKSFKIAIRVFGPLKLVIGVVSQQEDVLRLHKTHHT